jgi:hypothetical protein
MQDYYEDLIGESQTFFPVDGRKAGSKLREMHRFGPPGSNALRIDWQCHQNTLMAAAYR